jgi:hypothetical protein
MTRRPLFELHVSGPAFSAFQQVCKSWGLSDDQQYQLLGRSPDAASGPLSLDEVERVSYVLGIFRMLQKIAGDKQSEWLNEARFEPIFAGRSAIDLMCLADTRGLRQVSRHLEELSPQNPAEDRP